VLGVEFRDDLRTREIEAAIGRLQDRLVKTLGPVTNPVLIAIEPAKKPLAAV